MRNKCMGLQTKAKDKVAINEGEFNPEKNSSFYFGDFNNCTVTFNAVTFDVKLDFFNAFNW